MSEKRKVINNLVRFIVVFIVTMLISTGVRMLASVISGEHGAPSFVTPIFNLFGSCTQILLLLAYILIGYQMPIKSKILKGITFMALFWASDYLPQILGTFGGTSAVLNENAMSLKTILLDSVGYLLDGIVIGLFLTFRKADPKRVCNKKYYIIACIISMIIFPVVLSACEMIVGEIDKNLLTANAFAIQKDEILSFYLIFYFFQAVSGLLFPVFYRLTEYNRKQRSWFRFASVYGWMLWTPIVLIVMFFGINALSTMVYAFIMLIAIYIDVFVFAKIMDKIN